MICFSCFKFLSFVKLCVGGWGFCLTSLQALRGSGSWLQLSACVPGQVPAGWPALSKAAAITRKLVSR